MTASPPPSQRLRVAHLKPRGTDFDVQPDQAQRDAIAADLDLIGLPELRLTGRVVAEGAEAWLLTADLTARVVQPCVVTLEPVETAISDEVRVIYSPHMHAPEETEVEMPDDAIEPLGQFIDLAAVMTEALSLALPLYPRAPGAVLDEVPDDAPEEDEDRRRPFAGLADLLKKQ